MARELGLTQLTVLGGLHDNKLHHYHYSVSAHLFQDGSSSIHAVL